MLMSKFCFRLTAVALALSASSAFAQMPTGAAPGMPAGVPMAAGPNGAMVPPPTPPAYPPGQMPPGQMMGGQMQGGAAQANVVRGPAPSAEKMADELIGGSKGKARNPLEEVSRLNAELAALKAQLQIIEVKSAIKKKEDEMAPVVAVKSEASASSSDKGSASGSAFKKSKRRATKVVSESKPGLPPLPNFAGDAPTAKVGDANTAASSQGAAAGDSAAQKPAEKMAPRVLSIEGVDGKLAAELVTDWGGYSMVRPGDNYYDYEVVSIAPKTVTLRKDGQTTGFGIFTLDVQKIQLMAKGGAGLMGSAVSQQIGAMAGKAPVGTSPTGTPAYPSSIPGATVFDASAMAPPLNSALPAPASLFGGGGVLPMISGPSGIGGK